MLASAVRLPVAALLGTALALRPRRRGTPPRQPAVVQTQIVLAVVGALIMLVIGASLARAFGIVGAANLIRYRTVQEALRLFEADVTRNPYTPARSNLVVSPETAREMLTGFLEGAKKELAIYDETIQDPVMVKILEDLAARGVRVRVLGRFKGPGGDVAVRSLKVLRLHVRAIVRDGTRAFVGSQSLRKVELDKRREGGLLINNPAVTRGLLRVFDADWDASATKEERKEEKKHEAAVA